MIGEGTKSQDLLAMEDAFAKLLKNPKNDSALSYIERLLKRQFDLNFSIDVSDNSNGTFPKEFFGMSIYPYESTIDVIIDEIVNKKSSTTTLSKIWSENKEWHLEIDSIILKDKNINANPSELVAMVLHEIGHVIYSNSVIARLNDVMRYEMMKLSYTMKKLVIWKKAQKMFDLVLIEACDAKNYKFIRTNNEIRADKFVVENGYGDALNDLFGKILKTQGNDKFDRTDKAVSHDIKSVMNWTLLNISELEFRRKTLRTTLQTAVIQNPSRFVRGIIFNIKSIFFGGTDENNYKEMVTEQYLLDEYRGIAVSENFITQFIDKLGRIKKISQGDLDVLEVEKDRISTPDDKIYVLDLIYSYIDRIDYALDLIKDGKKDRVAQPKDTLSRLRAKLVQLRKDVLLVETDRQYGLFIKYPKGYEG